MAAGLLMLVWALLAPSRAVGAGWLVGFLFWLAIAVGALLLLAIHALTSGKWGWIVSPALRPAAATIPAFLLFGLPVWLSLPGLFPWAHHREAADSGVAQLYLNAPGWSARCLIAIVAWTTLAFLLLRQRGSLRLIGAIGLCVHGVVATMIGIDLILSLDGRFYSTAFAAALTTTQILAALSWVAATGIAPIGEADTAGDVAALMIAAALGSLYLGFSQYLVIWYGNIPERITWYLDRQHGPWLWIDLLAIALSGLLPVFALMRQRWRTNREILALIGYCVLAGLFAHLLWLVAPSFGTMAILSAILALVAIGGPWLALAYAFAAPRLRGSHAI